MPLTDKDRRIAYSIVRHLQDQVERGDLSEDAAEGIMVAQQCLCAAYEIDLSISEDRDKYEVEQKLEELFDAISVVDRDPGSTPQATSETTNKEEMKQKAEEYKQQGNTRLKENNFEEAVECYGKAIELDSSNATYFCNRAAAYIKISEYQKALDDCKKAVSLDTSYARAYGRMGYVYSLLEKPEEARECFRKAIDLDPQNENYKSNLETVEEQLKSDKPPGAEGAAGASSQGASGGPQAQFPPGGLPGFSGIAGMMQNPAFMNMATSLMSNPAFHDFAGRMMSQGGVPNPSNITSMMPNVAEAAQEMHRNNPEAFENLRQQASQFATGMGQGGFPPPPPQPDKPDKPDEQQ